MGLMGKSRLFKYKQDLLLEHFSRARKVERWIGFAGESVVDESYYRGACKGMRGKGAAGKSLYLLYLSEAGRFIRRPFRMRLGEADANHGHPKIVTDSIVYSDSWNG